MENKFHPDDITIGPEYFTWKPEYGESVKGNLVKLDLEAVEGDLEDIARILDYIKSRYTFISQGDTYIRFLTPEIYLEDLKNITQSKRTRKIIIEYLKDDFIKDLCECLDGIFSFDNLLKKSE